MVVQVALVLGFLVLVSQGLAPAAWAQSESGHAALEGRINDPSGAMVSGAHITAKEKSTGLARDAESNSEGAFRIAALPVGSYRLEVSAPGFGQAITDEVVVSVGETKSLSITLQLQTVATEVS